jgi:formylglycine-generating enzyme required for sulfatase activity/predicted Ser/Thr protein kinase
LELQNIGKYELNKFLGGGMSHVFMARDSLIGRTVAVKILTDSGAADPDTKARFIREAQLAGNVIHDNIIRVYDFGEESGRLFMVMEFLEGQDLNDAIKQKQTGSMEARISTAVQIAKAMEHVHSLGIVHRDLKPHNVYITTLGVAKLMDFGIAKTNQTSMTRTGFTVGTPSYMPPEQVLGKNVNFQSDIYSFGVLLFELITGTKPLEGDTVERVFWQILNEPMNLGPLREAGTPEQVVDLVQQCTAKDQAARPQTFAEVRKKLESVYRSGRTTLQATGGHLAAPPPGPATIVVEAPAQPAESAAKKWILPLAAAVVLVLGIMVFLLVRPKPSAPPVTTNTTTPVTPVVPQDMALVPAGTFLFGEKKEQRETPAYYVDKGEVTNAAYATFLKATGTKAPAGFNPQRADYPVTNLTIADARAFAKWAGKRLPTSLEWEKAARGTDGRLYPWGNDKKGGGPHGRLLTAAQAEASASPYGALQMSGNLWELVDQPQSPSAGALQHFATLLTPKPTAQEPWCMSRGVSYLDDAAMVPVYEWSSVPERFHKDDMGFRCVRDVK